MKLIENRIYREEFTRKKGKTAILKQKTIGLRSFNGRFQKRLTTLGTMVVDLSIRFAANYTYQVFSMGPGANAVGWD